MPVSEDVAISIRRFKLTFRNLFIWCFVIKVKSDPPEDPFPNMARWNRKFSHDDHWGQMTVGTYHIGMFPG